MTVDPSLLERWISARHGVEIRDAFDALPSTRHVVGTRARKLTLHGAAQLAGAMLGERADWICARQLGPATYQDSGITDDGSYLDHAWRIPGRCQADLRIHERRDGLRGVQLIAASAGTVPGEGRPEGGGMMFVRVFSTDPAVRAASIPIDGYGDQEVAVIGDVDLAPLDLYAMSGHFSCRAAQGGRDVTVARALVAQLLAEVDAHYDTSTAWREGPRPSAPEWWYPPEVSSPQTFVDGERAVTTWIDRSGQLNADVHGLPWGCRFGIQLSGGSNGYFVMRFPSADLDRIEARFAALAKA